MPKISSPQIIWERVSSTFVDFVERIFFTLGVVVARHPWRTVILTWLFVLVSCAGLLKFHIEKSPLKLWVPPDSDFVDDTNWYIDTFGTGYRLQKLLVKADNVLESKVLEAINNLTTEVYSIQVEHEDVKYSLENLCFQVPIVNFYTSNQKPKSEGDGENKTKLEKNSDSEFSDPTLWVDDDFYCSFLESFSLACLQNNIVDLWKGDSSVINTLTKHEIVNKVNRAYTNPITGHPTDYKKFLGGVEYDESGDIIVAKSIIITWFTKVNMSAIDLNEVGNLVGTEDWVTLPLLKFEQKYLDLMKNYSENVSGIKIFYEAGRSFGDISGESMFEDLDKLFIGIGLMFVYIIFALSRCNWLEIKLTLGSVGLLCVGMAYITAVSWCSVFEIPFGPVHSSLPFLLMGLGVDDMFVMKACWDNLPSAESKKSLPVKVGLMLQHAGVSIVITSFTDIVALLIGAITILPSLKSFCMYAAVGVFFIFCFSVTFYVAVFTLDLKRMESKRNGILFCYHHKGDVKISTEKSCLSKILCMFYKNVVFKTPVKIFVIILTLAMTGYSIHSILQLEQRFDPKWFIPDETYYKKFIDSYDHFYPNEGHTALVILGNMNYKNEFVVLHNMIQELRKEDYVRDMVTWVETFRGYVLKNFNHDLLNSTLPDEKFRSYLSRFLFSPVGGKFQINLKFSKLFNCGHPATDLSASSIKFTFARFEGPKEYIPAMHRVKDIVKSANITTGDGYRSVWSKVFANWVTDEIIAVEVERNVELALLCVMVCTVILITNLQMCLWIFICVLLTILNVLGWMQKWGMTVDIVCCIGLELAIGLCVDYAAHVGHTFLTISEGTRHERAYKTVTSIGTAVLLGGGSTFLSLSLLSMSRAYTFQSFFKIFVLVIVFGLFNGLIFLPVCLSLVGPSSNRSKVAKDISPETVELNGNKKGFEKEICDT